MDARKQTQAQLLDRRKAVINLHIKGVPVMRIVKDTGLSWHAVHQAITLYKEGDVFALEPKARGKKAGAGRVLSPEQESELREFLITRSPGNQLSMWNRDAAKQVIEAKCGITLSIRAVGNYLSRWGFVLKLHNKRPYDRCANDVKLWLDVNYADIERLAHAEHAKIYWSGKTAINTKPSINAHPSSERRWMISVVSNQGKIHWRIVTGKYDQEQQINFLKALVKISRHKVILIRDDARIYGQSLVLAWLKANSEKIKLFPDLTPDDSTPLY